MADSQQPIADSRVTIVRLSLMMFLQYAIWGVWAPILGMYLQDHLGFSGWEVGLVYMTMAIASILAPLIAGQIADRWFPTQFYLAVVHLLGAVILFGFAFIGRDQFEEFFWLMLLYQLLYAPTVGLTNSLAFHHLPRGERQFGAIRLWGTVSWILVGLAFGEWLNYQPVKERMVLVGQCLNWAGFLSIVAGIYCFTLPYTPPSRQPGHPLAFREALKLLKEPSFAVLLGISLLVSTEMQFYYIFGAPFLHSLGYEEGTVPQIMTIGQMMEVIVLAGLPWFVTRFGLRVTISIGILAWPIRYGIFAWGEPAELVVASQALHGLAFGFFFVGGQIYTDRVAGPHVRASAQSLMVLATFGLGMLLSSLVAGPVVDYFTTGDEKQKVVNWHMVFLVPVAITLIAALIFVVFFREKTRAELDKEFGREAT